MVYLYQQELTCEEIFLRLIRQTPKQDIARLLTTDMQKYIRLNQSYRPSALRLAYTWLSCMSKMKPRLNSFINNSRVYVPVIIC